MPYFTVRGMMCWLCGFNAVHTGKTDSIVAGESLAADLAEAMTAFRTFFQETENGRGPMLE